MAALLLFYMIPYIKENSSIKKKDKAQNIGSYFKIRSSTQIMENGSRNTYFNGCISQKNKHIGKTKMMSSKKQQEYEKANNKPMFPKVYKSINRIMSDEECQ